MIQLLNERRDALDSLLKERDRRMEERLDGLERTIKEGASVLETKQAESERRVLRHLGIGSLLVAIVVGLIGYFHH